MGGASISRSKREAARPARRMAMLKELVFYLRRLAQKKFSGTIRIEFLDGRVSLVRTEQILKPKDFATGDKDG